MGGVEAVGSDPGQFSAQGFFAIFAIDIQELGNRRWRFVKRLRAAAPTSQTGGQQVHDARQFLGADTAGIAQPSIMCCDFQFLQGVNPEIVMQVLGEFRPDARNRFE